MMPKDVRVDGTFWQSIFFVVPFLIPVTIFMYILEDFIINFKPGNPIPLGAERKGSFFTKKIKNLLFFLLSPEKSSILNMTEQKSKKSAERRRANGSKRAKCNDINKGKVVS